MNLDHKLFIKISRAAANLYGVIYSRNLYLVLKKYFNDLTYEELLKELDFLYKRTYKEFSLRKVEGKDGTYVLINNDLYLDDNYEDEKIQKDEDYDIVKEIIRLQGNKKIYIPKTFNQFIKSSNSLNITDTEAKYYDKLFTFIINHLDCYDPSYKNDEMDLKTYAFLATSFIYFNIKAEVRPINPIKMLDSLGVRLDNDVQIQEALDIMMNAANNTKMFVNNGFSPYELIKMTGGFNNIDDIVPIISPKLKERLINGDESIEEYLKMFESSNLPPKIKPTLRKQLQEIAYQKKDPYLLDFSLFI